MIATASRVAQATGVPDRPPRSAISALASTMETDVVSSRPQMTGRMKRPTLTMNADWATFVHAVMVASAAAQQIPMDVAKAANANTAPSRGPPIPTP